jgi:hypothetical protein
MVVDAEAYVQFSYACAPVLKNDFSATHIIQTARRSLEFCCKTMEVELGSSITTPTKEPSMSRTLEIGYDSSSWNSTVSITFTLVTYPLANGFAHSHKTLTIARHRPNLNFATRILQHERSSRNSVQNKVVDYSCSDERGITDFRMGVRYSIRRL